MAGLPIVVEKNLIGVEDLLFGFSTQQQTRGNDTETITEINAGLFPFDPTSSLQDIIDFINEHALDVEFVADNIDNILAITDDVLEAQQLLADSTVLLAQMQALVITLEAIDAVVLNAFMADVLAGLPGETFGIVAGVASWSELKFTPQSLSYDTTIPDNKNGVFFGDVVFEVDVDITYGINSNLIIVG